MNCGPPPPSHRSQGLGLPKLVGDVLKGSPLLVLIACQQPLPNRGLPSAHRGHKPLLRACIGAAGPAGQHAGGPPVFAAQTRTWSDGALLPPRCPRPPSMPLTKAATATEPLPCCMLAPAATLPSVQPPAASARERPAAVPRGAQASGEGRDGDGMRWVRRWGLKRQTSAAACCAPMQLASADRTDVAPRGRGQIDPRPY